MAYRGRLRIGVVYFLEAGEAMAFLIVEADNLRDLGIEGKSQETGKCVRSDCFLS